MLRSIVSLCLVLATTAAAPAQGRGLDGSWMISISEKHPEQLSLDLRTSRSDHEGSQFDRSDFAGLTRAEIESPTQVPVLFELRREAGSIAFEGTFRQGNGAGEFEFTANEDFPNALHALGVTFDPKNGERERELLNLTLFDVSTEFIKSMQKIGYDVSLEKFVEFRIFDVNPGYVREMASLGFDRLSADKLVETRIHGATPDYIRSMRAAGENLTLDKYIESRIFQVTPEFSQEMSQAGYPGLDRDRLVEFRIHGVTSEFIEQIRKLGYSHVPAEQLVAMRIHGVTPEFIKSVEAAGYHRVPIDKLVQMRIFDIDPRMVRALDDAKD